MIGEYHPGDLLAVVDAHGVALLPAATGDGTLAAVRSAIGTGSAETERAAAVLEALTFGTRMSELTPFAAAVVAEGGLHLLVRGDFELEVDGPEPARVAGAHVTSWREQWVPGATAVQISAGSAASAGGRRLPIERGVVPADVVRVAVDDDAWQTVATSQESAADVEVGVEPAGVREQDVASADLPADVVRSDAVRPAAVVPDVATPAVTPSAVVTPAAVVPHAVVPDAVLADIPTPAAVGPDAVVPEAVASVVRVADAVPSAVVPPDAPPAEPAGQTTLYGDITLGDPSALVAAVPTTPPDGDEEGATDFAFMWQTALDQGVERAAVRAAEAESASAPPGLANAVPANAVPPNAVLPSAVPAPPVTGVLVTGVPGPASARPAVAATPPDRPGDHDGETVMLEDILGAVAAAPTPSSPAPPGHGVLSRFCPAGHQNPPHAVACTACGAALTGEPRLGPRPTLGRLRLATGEAVGLDRTVVLGRRPQATRVSVDDVPRLVSVGGKEISRSHLELKVEEWSVVATDLGSRNGTMLLRPGQPPVRLVEPTPVRDGDRFDLGEGVVLGAEDVP